MISFIKWLESKTNENANIGGWATPVNKQPPPQQVQHQQQQQQQVSLSSFADKVSDPVWHQLYDVFSTQHQKFPNHPNVAKLGMALYQAAQNGDMSVLEPFKQQHLNAQRS